MNMLMTEWNWDDALAVRFEEGLEKGLEEGLEKGLEKVARNALAKGMPLDAIGEITGLDITTLERLAGQ
jgi:predicted transposase/invertase (TIGR01784 family)